MTDSDEEVQFAKARPRVSKSHSYINTPARSSLALVRFTLRSIFQIPRANSPSDYIAKMKPPSINSDYNAPGIELSARTRNWARQGPGDKWVVDA